MQDFKRIDAWKRAHTHVLSVRKAIQRFPRRGYNSLKAQILAAAESIPFNIVEGAGADSRKEFARFLDISVRSSFELEYQLLLARDYKLLPEALWASLTNETIEIRRMICAFRCRLREADAAERRNRTKKSKPSVTTH